MKLRHPKWILVFRVNELTAVSARADACTQVDEET